MTHMKDRGADRAPLAPAETIGLNGIVAPAGHERRCLRTIAAKIGKKR
jgi:hypothetical protein